MHIINRSQNRYSFVYVFVVLSIFVYVMIKSLGGGIKGFEQNIFKKQNLISTYNHLRYRLGDKIFPQVVVGNNGWLIFNSDGNLDSYQNVNLLTDRLEVIYNQIVDLNKYLKSRGITLIVVVAPNKETIYSENVPVKIQKFGKDSRMDLFFGMFNEDDRQIVLDLRKQLKQSQVASSVYYKTDTHWNAYGAYIAYQEILKNASHTYPDLLPIPFNEFEFSKSPHQTLDLAKLLGGDFLQEPRIVFQPKFVSNTYFYRIPPLSNVSISSSDIGTRKLLVYHDSFGDAALNSFLQYNFKDALYIRNATTDNDPFVSNWINSFDPDIVVIEIAERNMVYLDLLLSKLLPPDEP